VLCVHNIFSPPC